MKRSIALLVVGAVFALLAGGPILANPADPSDDSRQSEAQALPLDSQVPEACLVLGQAQSLEDCVGAMLEKEAAR